MVQRRIAPGILIIVGVAALFAVVWAFLPKTEGSGPNLPAPDIGVRAAAATVNLSDLKGKVVLIDFWATWCGPCRMSIPGIQKLYEKDKAKGFEVLGVSKDNEDTPAIKKFIQELGMTYPAGLPLTKESLEPYATGSIPSAFLVDRKGLVRWSQEGWSPDVEVEMEQIVEKLLKE